MKRFTETSKWRDPWFQGLSHGSKLLFIYICDNCDNAGFYEVNEPELCFHLGIDKAKFEGALKGLARGIKGASGWLWVRRFLRHQKNEELNPGNPAHKQIITLYRSQVNRFSEIPEFKEFIAPYKGLLSPIGIGIGIVQGKEESPERRAKAFSPPTVADAVVYGQELGMPPSEVESWHDHFTSNGWRVSGKAAMKDWQAALRNAKRNPIHAAAKNGTKPWKSAEERKQAEIDEANRLYRLKKLREQETREQEVRAS